MCLETQKLRTPTVSEDVTDGASRSQVSEHSDFRENVVISLPAERPLNLNERIWSARSLPCSDCPTESTCRLNV
jgi:hypothetical protein